MIVVRDFWSFHDKKMCGRSRMTILKIGKHDSSRIKRLGLCFKTGNDPTSMGWRAFSLTRACDYPLFLVGLSGEFDDRSHAPTLGLTLFFGVTPPPKKNITIPLQKSSSAWNMIVSQSFYVYVCIIIHIYICITDHKSI